MKNLNEKIVGAENFTYDELIRSTTAIRLGINNIPKSDIIWKNLEKLAVNCLQPIRNQFGPIRITSGYRTPELCLKIGSQTTSNHTMGFAADIEPYDVSIKLIDIINWIYNNLKWKELIAEHFPQGWVHIAYADNIYTTSIKLKDANHNYNQVSIDYLNKLYK